MAYTPAGRQQDNSILSQIMKYDKSVQPPQSYTNVSQQWTPFGRMEDWETLAKGLGKGIGVTAENIKEGAYKGTYDPREEGYKWAPGKLAAAGIGGLIGKYKERKELEESERRDAEIKAQIEGDISKKQFMQGQELLGEEFSEEDAAAAKKWYMRPGSTSEAKETLGQMEEWGELSPEEQDEATRVRSQSLWLQQMDPKEYRQRFPDAPTTLKEPRRKEEMSQDEAFEEKYGLKSGYSQRRKKFYEDFEKREELNRRRDINLGPDASAADAELARRQGKANLLSFQRYDTKHGKALDPRKLRRTSAGLSVSPADLRKFKDPKFYNKWKMKMRRFFDPLKRIPDYQSEYTTGGR